VNKGTSGPAPIGTQLFQHPITCARVVIGMSGLRWRDYLPARIGGFAIGGASFMSQSLIARRDCCVRGELRSEERSVVMRGAAGSNEQGTKAGADSTGLSAQRTKMNWSSRLRGVAASGTTFPRRQTKSYRVVLYFRLELQRFGSYSYCTRTGIW
jgi:hypothetical protein